MKPLAINTKLYGHELQAQGLREIQHYASTPVRHQVWNAVRSVVSVEIWSNVAWLVYLELKDLPVDL